MKKTILLGAAGIAMLSLAACCGNKSCDSKCAAGAKGDKTEIYTGVLPAADCDGIRYTLTLDYDHDDNDGDYKLIEAYLTGEGEKTFASEGDFTINKKDGKTYLKLVKDGKDSTKGSADGPLYFIVDSDSTLTMTNADLNMEHGEGLNYTLKLN